MEVALMRKRKEHLFWFTYRNYLKIGLIIPLITYTTFNIDVVEINSLVSIYLPHKIAQCNH